MDLTRKPRSNSILDSDALTDSQRSELRDMMLAGASHAACKQWLWDACSVEVKSGDTLTRFYKRHVAPVVAENRKLSAAKSETYVNAAGRTDWDAATTEAVKQTTFEILSGQKLDPKTADVFLKNVLRLRDQEDARSRRAEAMRTKEEAGIDALADAAKGDPEAEELLRKFHARLREVGRL